MSVILTNSNSPESYLRFQTWKARDFFKSKDSSRLILVDGRRREVIIYEKKVRAYGSLERAARIALAILLTFASLGTLLSLKGVRNLWIKGHERVLLGKLNSASEVMSACSSAAAAALEQQEPTTHGQQAALIATGPQPAPTPEADLCNLPAIIGEGLLRLEAASAQLHAELDDLAVQATSRLAEAQAFNQEVESLLEEAKQHLDRAQALETALDRLQQQFG